MLVMIAACDSSDGSMVPDAPPPPADAREVDSDPFICQTTMAPVAPAPACLALAPASLQGSTPFGDLDVDLSYFGAGDCITISHATIQWVGQCQEEVTLQFSYPVTSDSSAKRSVMGSFDEDASIELRAYGEAPRRRLTNVHVDVTQWQEGDGVHSIDMTLTITDPAFTIAPLHIAGTFCDWPYYLC